jgi:hypothetical protein
VLVDVSGRPEDRDLSAKPANLPLAIAPTGGISAGRFGAELILARAAKAAGVPFTMATPSAFSIERVAEEVGGRLWFQLYAVRNLDFRKNSSKGQRTPATRRSSSPSTCRSRASASAIRATASTRPTARTGATRAT